MNAPLFPTDLVESLKTKGWYASSDLVPQTIAHQLREQLLIHKNQQTLKPAQIGQGENKKARPDIRGDSILWLEPEKKQVLEDDFFKWLTEFKHLLNQHLLMNLTSEELHYALYPPGAGYQKHRDCFATSDQRALSFVLYLNNDWNSEDMGQIVLYNEVNPEVVDAQISPTFAQCVIFLSASIFHEVIFTKAERISVTGWLKKPLP